MEKLINIPEEITLIYCNPINTDKIYPAIIDKKLLTNQKRQSLQTIAINLAISWSEKDELYDKDNIKELTIVNSDLMLSINTGSIHFYNYSQEVFVRLLKKGIDILDNYKFIIRCGLYNFFELLKNTYTISNGIINGSYCLQYNSIDSYTFVENLFGDKEIKESKRISKLFSSNKKTSKWIPGGKYYISPTEYVIYLGEYKKSLFLSYWSSRDRFKKCFNSVSYGSRYVDVNDKGTISLCIPHTLVGERVKEIINLYKDQPIDIFIKSIIKYDLRGDVNPCICAIKNSTKKGVLDKQLFLNNINKDCDITNEFDDDLIDILNHCNDSDLEINIFKIISKFNPNLLEKAINKDRLIDKIKLGIKNELINKIKNNSWYRDRYVNLGGSGVLINGDFEGSTLLNHIISNTTNVIDKDKLIEYIQNIIDSSKNG